MDLNVIDQKTFDGIFRNIAKTAWVTIKKSKVKATNYDPYRDTGYAETQQNPLPVKVITKTITPNSLVYRDLGLVKAGSIQVILKQSDVELIKQSDKIVFENKEYYVYDDAVGNKFQEFPIQFSKYSKIIIFRKDV